LLLAGKLAVHFIIPCSIFDILYSIFCCPYLHNLRRLSSIFCLFLLLLSFCGRGIYFEIRMAEVRTEMRSLLESGNKAPLSEEFHFDAVAARTIKWLEGGREFEWNGQRYDVLTRQEAEGTLHVTAVSDQNETELVAAYRKGSGKDNSQHASVVLLKLLSLPYLATTTEEQIMIKGSSFVSSGRWLEKYPDPSYGLITPPPRQVFFFS
jgi:hypothetical protein